MPEIVVLGEALVDLFSEAASLGASKAFYPSPGGAPANVAVALARLGASVGFIGKVGDDGFGELLQSTLAKHGVDTAHFTADTRASTMLAVVASPSPQEQQFVLYNGANELLEPTTLPTNYIENADIFIYGSVTLSTRSRAAALKAAALAHAAKHHVIFDVNLRPALWENLDEAKIQIEKALETTTILKVNEAELEFLTGTKDSVKGSQFLLDKGIELCCVSLGDKGAYLTNGHSETHVPAFKVEVENTTGSGDAFVAGLAVKLSEFEAAIQNLSELELRTILQFANACGALVASQQGAMSAELSLDLVNELLQIEG